MFKELGMYFSTKRSIVRHMKDVDNILEKRIIQAVEKCKELEKGRVYYAEMLDARADDLESAQRVIEDIQSKISWTLPLVVFTNVKIKEYPKKELRKLFDKAK